MRKYLFAVPLTVAFLTSGIAADKYRELDGSVATLQSESGTWNTGTTLLWGTASAGAALTDNDSALFRTGDTNSTVSIVGTVQTSLVGQAVIESHTIWSEYPPPPEESGRLIHLRMWQVFGCETTKQHAEFSIERRWTFSDSQETPVEPPLPGKNQRDNDSTPAEPEMALFTFGGILLLFILGGILLLHIRSRSSSLRPEVSHGGSRASPISQISKKSVLIVDDDEGMTSMLAMFLGRYNYAASQILDSTKVIEWLRANTCDAIILDLMMPKLDGVSLLRMIRAQYALPVVVFTGSGYQNDRVTEVMRAGATAYVTKADGLEELSSTLRRVPSLQPQLNSGSTNRMRPRKCCLPPGFSSI